MPLPIFHTVIDPRGASVTVFTRTGLAFDDGRDLGSGPITSLLFPDLEATVEQILAH